jgi:purine-binding chemotaxis protein CheW
MHETIQESPQTKAVAAAANAAAAPGHDHSQYLTFVVAGETFAIGIMAIKEIIEYGDLTVVPMMPHAVRGVINLRGAVVPVIDLGVCFKRQSSTPGKRTCIVIVEVACGGGRQIVGVIVDAVNEVLEIPREQIEPPPAFGARIKTEFIAGMGKVGGRFVILIDVNHALSVDDLGTLAAAADAPAALAIAA